MREKNIDLPGGLEIAVSPDRKKEGAFKLSLQVSGKPSGIDLIYDPLEQKGGLSFTLDVLVNGAKGGRYCSCNGVSMDCPEGKSPHCDCTKNPPSLSCA